jgi:hypothetical protein
VTSDQTREEARELGRKWRQLCEAYPLRREAAA